SAVLSQEEAAGSVMISSMLGKSPAVEPSLIQNSSRSSARNCIDARAPLVGYIKRIGILGPVRGNQLRTEQVTMTAAEAAHSRCDSGGSILEGVGQRHTLAR